MQIEKYEKLKTKIEVLKLEKNFYSLNKILYYFSFLGNIFLIYFGYFFIKSIVDTLPNLFPYQNVFLSIFIGLFLLGYELTKRFVVEQFSMSILQIKKLTSETILGLVVSLLLIAGSFYLSINGAHRLIDNTSTIINKVDDDIVHKKDSISRYYEKEIEYYRLQPSQNKQDRKYRDSIVASIQLKKDAELSNIENKTENKSQIVLEKNKENDSAFLFMTFFLEFIIILGVGFNSFYTLGSYNETKILLNTPKYKQLMLNLELLKLYYQNGKKQIGDQTISANKMILLVKNQKLTCTQNDLKNFIVYCSELDIIKDNTSKTKKYEVSYDVAKQLIMKEAQL
jgi:hypothetical protein